MQKIDRIAHAEWILPGGTTDQHTALHRHSLLIDKGIILDILPTQEANERYQASTVNEYSHHILTPGFVNAHTHIGMNFFRGLGSDLALMDWLTKHMWPAEKQWLDHAFVRDASLFAMAEMIRSGTTCFNDMYFFLQATAEAADIAGMRAFIGITVLEFPTNWAQTVDEYMDRGLEFYNEYRHHPLITTTFAPHAPYTISDDTFRRIHEKAMALDLKINLHVHETQDEIDQSMAQFNQRPLARLDALGLLSPRLLVVHAANLNDDDLARLEKNKPHIIHCPESNMKLASGICPVAALQARNINVALGTDSVASNNDLDMISEMRQANFLSKISTKHSLSLPAQETFALATINGAKALGIDKTIGSLQAGKSADFIAISTDTLEMLPMYDPCAQVVYASNRHQVTDVFVAGKQLMKNRELLTLDEEALKAKARDWGKKIRASQHAT